MKKLATLVFCLFLASSAAIIWYNGSLKPIDPDSEARVTVKIPQGYSVNQIATLLKERNIIQSEFAFKTYTKLNDLQDKLQAGSFVLKQSLSVEQLAEILQTGKAEEIILTIPEGFTVMDIDSLLAEKGLIEKGAFSKCARECDFSAFNFLPSVAQLAERGGQVEGYLYPDTYFVIASSFSAESFMKRLLSTFEKKIVEGMSQYFDESGYSLQQIISMASLIEEEASNDEERPFISGILWKRFDADMGLGVDATVRYILNKSTEVITVADLNDNNPYNTRKFKGLPPGPIANPGYQSILSALKPRTSKYWYYLHDPTGQIRYAETNTEHNLNKNKYLK